MSEGAYFTGVYPNHFLRIGVTQEEVDARLEEIFNTLFYGSEEERIYHQVEPDMGYIVDTGNIDARTEGMSYGMMMCVQLDHKEEFDRIWKWAKTYMFLEEGFNKGFFCWSNALDGTKNSGGAAPDGEEYFAMALFFASHRWGDGEGIFNYSKEASELLHTMLRKGVPNELGRGMFDLDNYLIRFITDVDFSDPSYHLPHFYELFAKWTNAEDRTFYANAAAKSREYLHKACHEESGLSGEYAFYDGRPADVGQDIWGKHDWYYSDAYRTILNIALDNTWFAKDPWQNLEGERFLRTFCEKVGEENWNKVLDWDGTVRSEDVLHPVAVIATNAAAGALVDNDNALKCIKKFWDTPLREGPRRYYDNCLYLFAFMLLSGNYKVL